MKIAIAACRTNPRLSRSNDAYRQALEALGAEVTVRAWNADPMDAFLAADLTVLRQTWDYQADPGGFAAWLVRLEALGARVEAPAHIAVWNNDKRTLAEIGAAGIAIPQTIALSLDLSLGLSLGAQADAARAIATEKIVLKPAFGGDGVGVGLCDHASVATTLEALQREVPGRPFMAQEFLPEIAAGEWKMTCIDGQVRLSVRATPPSGEFRINGRFGPTVELAEPPPAARQAAQRIMALTGTPLCGRVDGVMRADAFLCTEIELCDPDLHLHHDPTVAEALAQATLRRAHRRTGSEQAPSGR